MDFDHAHDRIMQSKMSGNTALDTLADVVLELLSFLNALENRVDDVQQQMQLMWDTEQP